MARVALTRNQLIEIAEKLGGHDYTDSIGTQEIIDHIVYLAGHNVDVLIA